MIDFRKKHFGILWSYTKVGDPKRIILFHIGPLIIEKNVGKFEIMWGDKYLIKLRNDKEYLEWHKTIYK